MERQIVIAGFTAVTMKTECYADRWTARVVDLKAIGDETFQVHKPSSSILIFWSAPHRGILSCGAASLQVGH